MNRRLNAVGRLLLVAVVAWLPSCNRGSTTESTELPPTTVAADTPAEDQLEWVIGLLNGAELRPGDYEGRFDQAFRDAVPYETGFLPVLAQLQATAPYRVIETEPWFETGLRATLEAADTTRLPLLLDVGDQGLITDLLVQPAELAAPPQSLEEAASQLGELGEVSMLAAEVVGSECQPLFTSGSTGPVPLGSTFKLYVLGALADAVEAGEVTWTDEIVIIDELKSIPSGQLQNRPAGSTTTMQEAAELMISISDNTATDLINLLGREEVEQAQSRYRHSQPELNIPCPTTREFAVLNVGPDSAALRAAYLTPDVAGRRQILADISHVQASTLLVSEFVNPVDPDQLEWFASLADLCTVHVLLQEKSRQPGLEPLAEILTLNPGIPSEQWQYIAFKGGSEPGLVTASWLVRGADQRTFVLAASVLNPERLVEELQAVSDNGCCARSAGSLI